MRWTLPLGLTLVLTVLGFADEPGSTPPTPTAPVAAPAAPYGRPPAMPAAAAIVQSQNVDANALVLGLLAASGVPGMPGLAARPVSYDEANALVEGNPGLVRQLLRLSSEDQEMTTLAIYCLGPAAAPGVIAELDSEDEKLRTAAGMAMMGVCAHEQAPRGQIVAGLLERLEKPQTDAERTEFLQSLLLHTVMCTRPEYRLIMRASIEQELSGGIGFQSEVPYGGYASEPQYGQPAYAPIAE